VPGSPYQSCSRVDSLTVEAALKTRRKVFHLRDRASPDLRPQLDQAFVSLIATETLRPASPSARARQENSYVLPFSRETLPT